MDQSLPTSRTAEGNAGEKWRGAGFLLLEEEGAGGTMAGRGEELAPMEQGREQAWAPWRGARLPAAAAVGCLLRDGEEDMEAAVAAGKNEGWECKIAQVQGERAALYRRSPRVRVFAWAKWAGLDWAWPKTRTRAALNYFFE
jgi:hypothetical protein